MVDATPKIRVENWWRSPYPCPVQTGSPYKDESPSHRDDQQSMPAERNSVIKAQRTKRESKPVTGGNKPKRARKTIPESEQNPIFKQVTDPKLDAFKISIPDAEGYYVPELINIDTSNRWYTDLANLS